MAREGTEGGPAPMRRLEPVALLDVLAEEGVEYIVVGGYAVAAHGFPRATKDIDICPQPSEGNLRRLAAALAEGLGEEGSGGWAELRPHAVKRSFLGHECLFCSYEDLLKMKTAAGRDQDQVDVRTLRAQRHHLTP